MKFLNKKIKEKGKARGGYRKRNELGGAQRHRRAAIHPFFCARRKRETKIPKPIQSRCRETIRKQGGFSSRRVLRDGGRGFWFWWRPAVSEMGSGMSSFRRPRGFVFDPTKGMIPLLGLAGGARVRPPGVRPAARHGGAARRQRAGLLPARSPPQDPAQDQRGCPQLPTLRQGM